MQYLKTESPFNHWLNKRSFTAFLLCLFAVCSFGFKAAAANSKPLIKTGPVKVDPPVITSFSPARGPVGTILTINGDNLDDVDHVSINNIYQLILSKSKTTITAMIMPGTVDGQVHVHKGGGGVIFPTSFLVTVAQPPTSLQNDRLGTAEGSSIAVSADGNTLAVEPNHYSCRQCTFPPDSAVVYRRNSGNWSVYAKLPSAFNIKISADGKTLTTTIYRQSTQPAAGIYIDNGAGQFVQQFELMYIQALSADGNTVLVRTPENQIVTYKRNLGTWAVFGDPIVRADEGFGSNIALSGDAGTVLITDDVYNHAVPYPAIHPYQPDSLKAWVYVRNGNSWSLQTQLPTFPGNAQTAGQKGDPWYWDGPEYQDLNVAISADGNRILFNPLIFINRSGAKMASFTRTGTIWTKQDAGDIVRGVVALSADGQTGAAFSGNGVYYTRIMKYVGTAWNVVYENSIDRTPPSQSATVDASINPPSWRAIGNLSADGSTAVAGTNRSSGGGVIVYANALPVVEPIKLIPSLSSITPTSGAVGTVVTVEGNNLDSLTSFNIGGVAAITLSKTNTKVVGMLMTGATTGPVTITTPTGTASSEFNFTVKATGAFLPTKPGVNLIYNTTEKLGLGYSGAISADGKTAAATTKSTSGSKALIIVYALINNNWVQQAVLQDTLFTGIETVVQLSADGNTLHTNGSKLGIRYEIFFNRVGTNWTRGITLAGDYSWVKMSADAKTLLVSGGIRAGNTGSTRDLAVLGVNNGVVTTQRVWESGTTTAIPLDISAVGLDISADGNTIITNQPPKSDSDMGHVVIYDRTNGVWPATGTEIFSYPSSNKVKNVSLSGDGRTAFVTQKGLKLQEASIQTFTRTSANTWVQGSSLLGHNGLFSVSMDGTLVLDYPFVISYYSKLINGAWINIAQNDTFTSQGSFFTSLTPSADKVFFGFPNYNGGIGAAQIFDEGSTNVASFSPASGPAGTIVTIYGSGLNGLTPVIGGKPAVILSATNNMIKAMVTVTTSGKITFKENATTIAGNFTVTPQPLPTYLQTQKLGRAEGATIALSADGNTMVVQKLVTPQGASPGGIPDSSIVNKRRSNGTWYKYAALMPKSYATKGSGFRISADGATILSNDGIFVDNGDGTYTQQLSLEPLQRNPDGMALSAGGDLAIVQTATSGPNPIFSLTPYMRTNGTWQQGESFTKANSYYFGSFIALSADGETLLTSDSYNYSHPDSLGIYVYTRSGNTFVEQFRLPSTVVGLEAIAVLGISADGNTAVVNLAHGGTVPPSPAIYMRNGSTWAKTGELPSVGTEQCRDCKVGISFSADGTTLLAGNRLFKNTGGAWNLAATLDDTFTDVGAKKAYPGPRDFRLSGFSALSADGSTAALGQVAYYDSGVKVFSNTMPAVAPTLSTTKLMFTNITSNSTTVSWTKGNGSKRAVFIAKTANGVAAPVKDTTYNANTAFGTGKQIGATGWYAVYNGDGNSVNITGLASSATYRVTVVEYNGASGDEKYLLTNLAPASVITALSPNDPPTAPSLQLTFSNTTATTTKVSWTSGNGTMRALFVAKTANGVAAPVNDNIYNANATFGTGSQIGGTGWYCVYNGTGNSADISGLDPLTTYRVTVVDYNNTGAPKYMNTKLAPASVVTLTSPSVTPTTPSLKLTFANIAPTSTTVNWISGNGSRRAVFVARRADGVAAPTDNTAYSANANFAAGSQIGTTGWYCVYDGTGASANISGLTPGTTYRVTVVDYNGNAGNQKYMNTRLAPASIATAATSPTIPSLKLTFTNTTTSTTNVSWISGNGALRAVFVARTANGVANAVNNTTYTANQSFGAGTQIGSTGWYCVYNGNGSNTNITGLVANTIYRVTVIEYNGGSGTQLYTNDKLSPAIVTTIPAGPVQPTGPSLYLTFSNTTNTATTVNWNSGNGARRAVFVARRSDGVAAPTDNTTYTGNPTFAAGTQVGATGWYCVYDGTGSSADITGLTAGTVYRVTVVDYNGAPGTEKYMNTRLAPASIITATGSGLRLAFTSLKSDTPADELGLSEIEASNLLSPNGDGKNDTWMVKNIEQYQNNSVTVYDQGSNVVYTKKGYTNDWAGTYRGGVVKEGTYYYLIDLGNGTTKKGFITVLSSRQ